MSKEELDYFLSGRLLARLSTIAIDGFPTITPVYYLWDGKAIFFNLGKNRVPTRNLKRNPKCGAVVDLDERPLVGLRENFAKGVTMTGRAELFDADRFRSAPPDLAGTIDFSEALKKIGRRYTLPSDDDDRISRMISEATSVRHPILIGEHERVLVRMEPTKIKGWDFSKAPFKD